MSMRDRDADRNSGTFLTKRTRSQANQRPPESPGPRLIAENAGLIAVNIGKSFKKRPVLRGVTIAVQRGEAVGLLGPNGAGKTTCFYIITGLLAPDSG
ncbi:MAG TPA: ATP-binding cassette domain-containing protein, partial [Kiloniellales bacterium]|nr:ATP-binding cassette domain-containing protein [Kiloniellales bacterium]